MKPLSRRSMFGRAGRLAGAFAVGLPLAEAAGTGQSGESQAKKRKLKVVVAGAHPDDPESGCGGTIAQYSDLGHEVAIIYLTRGESGIEGKSHQEAATIRTTEARKACEILKARPVFAGQVNGNTEVNPTRYEEFHKILVAEQPDLVFTHWPIDTHPDHRAISLLVYDSWLRNDKQFALYYFEVLTGEQTSQFWPTHYVDITQTETRKRAACFAHASQNPADLYSHHEAMNRFRGLECGCKYAEAFARHVQSSDGLLPLNLPR